MTAALIPLRPYQEEGFKELKRCLGAVARGGRGLKRIVFVLATGGGKTVVASHLVHGAVAKGSRTLFVAHRKELIKQAFCKLVRNGVSPADIGIVMAGVESKACLPFEDPRALVDDDLWLRYARRRPGAPVQIAGVDTLRGKAVPPSDLVIIDECHRALSAGYVRLLQALPGAVFVGLTATPERADRRGLNEPIPLLGSDGQPTGETIPFFEDLVVGATYTQLFEDGFLVEPEVWTVPAQELEALERVKLKGGDYDQRQLAAVMDNGVLVGSIVDHWRRRAHGLPTLAFGVDRDHSRHMAEQLQAAGIRALYVDGESEDKVRDLVRHRLSLPFDHADRLDVVTNCEVYVEGFDCPAVKCVILARPTKSLRIYLQQVGRGSRPDGLGSPFVVLDHAGCAIEHGLPQEDREWSLDGKKKSPKAKSAPTRVCEKCFAVLPAGTPVCPRVLPDGAPCGFVFPMVERDTPVERDGELVAVRAATLEEMRATWDALCLEREAKNRVRRTPIKPGWVFHRFREIYRRHPPGSFPRPVDLTEAQEQALGQSAEARTALLDRLVREAIRDGRPIGWVRMQVGKKRGERFPSNEELSSTAYAREQPEAFATWSGIETSCDHEAPSPPPVVHAAPPPAPPAPSPAPPPARPRPSLAKPPAPPPDVKREVWSL